MNLYVQHRGSLNSNSTEDGYYTDVNGALTQARADGQQDVLRNPKEFGINPSIDASKLELIEQGKGNATFAFGKHYAYILSIANKNGASVGQSFHGQGTILTEKQNMDLHFLFISDVSESDWIDITSSYYIVYGILD